MNKTNAKTAVAAKAARPVITAVKPITSGMDGTAIEAKGEKTLLVAKAKMSALIAAKAIVGGDYNEVAKLVAEANSAKLARGVDSRSAPHSAKAVVDNKAAASNKADKAVTAKKTATDAKADRKAKRAEKATPKADDNRKITVVDKKFTYGAEGTARRIAWDKVKSGITVSAYIASGGKAKYLSRWVSAGAIKLA